MNEVASNYRPLSPLGREGLVRYLVRRYGTAAALLNGDGLGDDLAKIAWAVDDVLHAYGADDGGHTYGVALDNVLDEAPQTWSAVVSVVARTIREELAR